MEVGRRGARSSGKGKGHTDQQRVLGVEVGKSSASHFLFLSSTQAGGGHKPEVESVGSCVCESIQGSISFVPFLLTPLAPHFLLS